MAGLLKKDSGHVSEGGITYNGDPQNSSQFSLPKVAHFAEQVIETAQEVRAHAARYLAQLNCGTIGRTEPNSTVHRGM